MPRAQPQAVSQKQTLPYRQVEEEEEGDQGITMGATRAARESLAARQERLTRFGTPDRRFKGQRDLEPAEMSNPNYTQPRQGGVIDDIHVTLGGRPDRRFKENRSLSDDEIVARQIDVLQSQIRQRH